MSAGRPNQTLADYVALALSPQVRTGIAPG